MSGYDKDNGVRGAWGAWFIAWKAWSYHRISGTRTPVRSRGCEGGWPQVTSTGWRADVGIGARIRQTKDRQPMADQCAGLILRDRSRDEMSLIKVGWLD